MRVSVVIPALNEAARIHTCIAGIPPGGPDLEIVVADGGSLDGTREVAARAGARVVEAPAGRGPQMNAGAAASKGEVLLFLHADTTLPPDAWSHVQAALADRSVAGGAFLLAFHETHWYYRMTARNANVRSRLLGAPYGDQAIFVRRDAFEAVGGYRNLRWCEDLDLVRRLRSEGRVVLLPAAVRTSARRWEVEGRVRVTVRNALLLAAYYLGRIPENPAPE